MANVYFYVIFRLLSLEITVTNISNFLLSLRYVLPVFFQLRVCVSTYI